MIDGVLTAADREEGSSRCNVHTIAATIGYVVVTTGFDCGGKDVEGNRA